jgi:hypothetical protein
MDFTGATKKFYDEDWDGPPVAPEPTPIPEPTEHFEQP